MCCVAHGGQRIQLNVLWRVDTANVAVAQRGGSSFARPR
jgi:hypothetical protein